MDQYRDIARLLRANTGSQRMLHVFGDFTEMAALAFRNAVDHHGRDDREARYLEIAGKYDREQLDRFAQALALVTIEMEERPSDVLGRLYMELELGNNRLGQFFTPYSVACLIAQMTVDPLVEKIRKEGFAELYEPACGAGAFIVAMTQELLRHSVNYQRHLLITAEDVSAQAVHMVYVHLSLLHVPGLVHRRNTLSQETFDTWPTPAYIFGGWRWGRTGVDPIGTGSVDTEPHHPIEKRGAME